MNLKRSSDLDEHARLSRAIETTKRRHRLFDRLARQTGEAPDIILRRNEAAMDLERLNVDIARVRMRLTVVEG